MLLFLLEIAFLNIACISLSTLTHHALYEKKVFYEL